MHCVTHYESISFAAPHQSLPCTQNVTGMGYLTSIWIELWTFLAEMSQSCPLERKTDDRSGSHGIEWYVDTCDFVFKSLWVKCERGPLMLDWVRISSRKKVFPSSNGCLRRLKVHVSRETDLIMVVYAFKYLIAFGERKMKAPQVMPRCEDTEPTNAYYRHIYESHASSSAWMVFALHKWGLTSPP